MANRLVKKRVGEALLAQVAPVYKGVTLPPKKADGRPAFQTVEIVNTSIIWAGLKRFYLED
jgi:hypothetical protein